MKLNLARLFETSLVATTNAFKDLAPFFDYFNQLSDTFVRSLTNGISLADNVDGQRFMQKMRHNTTVNITLKRRPIEIRIMGKNTFTPSIASFDWQINADETIALRVKYDDTTYPHPIEINFYAHFS